MCLPIRLPAHEFFTIMKFHNNEIHNNERTPGLDLYYIGGGWTPNIGGGHGQWTSFILVAGAWTPKMVGIGPLK